MPSSLANAAVSAHHVLPEKAVSARAKALLRNPEIEDCKSLIGRAIQRAVQILGWSNKETAAKVGVDDAQFGKWISGRERPQMDKLWAVEAMRIPLVQAFAEQCAEHAVEIRTVITLRQKAVG